MLGLAHDLKKMSQESIEQRIERTGDPMFFAKRAGWSEFRWKMHGALDWTYGILLNAYPIWLGLILRLIYLTANGIPITWDILIQF
jgi:hypothetical protein